MYNKYIFINNNRRKKQNELNDLKVGEVKNNNENSQISFDMLQQISKNENKPIQSIEKNLNKTKGRNLMKFVDDYVLVDIENNRTFSYNR